MFLDSLATNVAIITVPGRGGPHGTTANVWGESGDPAVALITLRSEGGTLPSVQRNGIFGASVLGSSQVHVAKRFARRERMAGERFEGQPHRVVMGCPVLPVCHVWAVCSVEGTAPFGSYTIVVGRVVEAGPGGEAAPLLYHGGTFGDFRPEVGP